MELETPRDRKGSFEPKIVAKGQTRFTGFDDKIVSMYARGMTTREIEAHLQEIYGVDVSPGLISNVTEAVMEEVKVWQSRPLDEVYPILYMDALRVEVRDGGHVVNKAIHVAIGVNIEGKKEVLGLWTAQNEGAKFWLQVLTEIQNRGVKDIFIACVDGLKGFPEAIETVYPKAEVQICIVHLVRSSLELCELEAAQAGSRRSEAHLSPATAMEAEQLGKNSPRNGMRSIRGEPGLAAQLEPDHSVFRLSGRDPESDLYDQRDGVAEYVAAQDHQNARLVSDREAAMKLLYLALRNASKKWTMPIQNWSEALNRFAILWPERMPTSERAAA